MTGVQTFALPILEKAVKSYSKKVRIPGFRPGMVPQGHIKKLYGKSILLEEINDLLSDSLNNYISENKLEILGQPLPKLEDEKEYNWDFNDEFEFAYELGLEIGRASCRVRVCQYV